MDPTAFTKPEFISELRSAQFESIAKSSKFTSSQKKKIKDTRLSPLLDALDTSRPGHVAGTAAYPALIKKMITKGLSRKDVAGLMSTKATFIDYTGTSVTESILVHPEVMKQYNPSMLKLMAQEMTPGDIETIKNAIQGAVAYGGAAPEIVRLDAWLGTDDGKNNFA